jgi:SNF2 family DNA or RNA helicase
MPDASDAGPSSSKGKAKAAKLQTRIEAECTRASRIKAKSRATLIICPLSTVSNWEDQFREHWRGEVTVIGGAGGVCSSLTSHVQPLSQSSMLVDVKPDVNALPSGRVRGGKPLRVYVYHGNARRPEPSFLADFDAVITTYATLASEFSKQNRSIANAEAEDEDEDGSSDGGVDIDERGNHVLRLPKVKRALKRKKSSGLLGLGAVEAASALQSIHWFRVVLDEAQ